ncbi:hypothetical protein DFH08DRAFT_803959 [Mycena albidolilacea]|uniref:Hydrophobin n=1 Tax=Mycena albidolilacea TaxID=1033008 RepID=A0AAD7EVU3_9AGAR|nr:hypothetical protein DFH08DRAFT_803959 [Mycena albidolilacea]
MQFNFFLLPLVILADVSSIYGSALGTVQARNLAVAGDLTSRDAQCNWCDCLTALAAEGVACAAAAVEAGCIGHQILSQTFPAFLMSSLSRNKSFSPPPPPPPPPPPKLPGRPTPPVTPRTSPQCCSSVVPSDSDPASAVASLLGLDLTGIDVLVGLSCSPITVEGDNCGSTTVTCDAPEKEWGGLIAINCIPITL